MDILKAAPEQLANFVNFVVLFVRSPHAALQPYGVTDETRRPAVNGQLILFCTLSVGCGTLMMTIGQVFGMAEDRSWSVAIWNRLDPKLQPLAAVFAIIVVSAFWHGLTRTVSALLGRLVPDLRFDGAIENSVNAGLAFGAFYLLAWSALLVAIRLGAAHTSLSPFAFLLVIVPLAVGFLVYFVLAFAAVHRVRPASYFLLFVFTLTAAMLIGQAVDSLRRIIADT